LFFTPFEVRFELSRYSCSQNDHSLGALGRESLYKALSSGAHPRYETVYAVLRALGVKFAVVTAPPQSH
jgi:hypothetical protein